MIGGGIVGVTTALLLHEAGAPRRADRGQPDRPRRHRPHDGQGLLPARADLRAAAVQARRGGGAARTARPTRRRWSGSPPASSATGSTATSGGARPTRTSDSQRSEHRGRGARRRPRPACRRRSSSRRRCRSRSQAPCASTTRPSSTRRSTCSALAAAAARGLRAHARGPGRRRSSARPAAGSTPSTSIVATHFPFPDRSLAFARAHPQRSYAIACRIAGEPPDGHVHQRRLPHPLGPRHPGRRRGVADGRRRGPPHRHGRRHRGALRARWRPSRASTGTCGRSSTAGRRRTTRRVDGLPFVGPLTPFDDRVLMATGFAKWGMTGGTAAALHARRPRARPRRTRTRRCSTRPG